MLHMGMPEYDAMRAAGEAGCFASHLAANVPREKWATTPEPLVFAVRYNDKVATRMLMRAGACPTNVIWTGDNAFNWAGSPNMVDLLCAMGHSIPHDGVFSFFADDRLSDRVIVEAMIRNGVNPQRVRAKGGSRLPFVPRKWQLEIWQRVRTNRRAAIALLAAKRARRVLPLLDRYVFREIALQVWAAR